MIPLESSAVARAATILAAAFNEDPLLGYVFPDVSQRQRLAAWLYGTSIRYALRNGLVHTTSDMEGVAVWLLPGRTELRPLEMFRSGMFATPFKLGWTATKKLQRFHSFQEKVRQDSVSGAYWYLMLLGVEPAQMGKGIGSALIQPELERAASEGLPCFLDTTNPRAVSFYEKLGFKRIVSREFPPGGFPVWGLLKEPGR